MVVFILAIMGSFFMASARYMDLWMLAGWMDPKWLAERCPKVAALATKVSEQPLIAPIHAAHFG